jgi:ribosomal protein S12 methylthiotransferase
MAERYMDEIIREIPEADAALGIKDINAIVGTLKKTEKKPAVSGADLFSKRLLLPVSHIAYVRISDGCDNRCTYCTIPFIRGPFASRVFEEIIRECRALAERGARELVIVAQDTALYGNDLYGKPRLHELLNEISKINGLTWIRVMYAYPEHITDELIESIACNEKVCNYLDMPIQHASDTVLRRMGRKNGRESLTRLISSLRERIPDIALRTTLIAGFPGETEDEFNELRDFVKETRFDRLGVFMYSREDGTPAAKMKPQIKKTVKRERYDALMMLQREIHFEKQKAMIGKTVIVMVDGAEPSENGAFICEGRMYTDAYETDSVVVFERNSNTTFNPGNTVNVVITGSDGYDLEGKPNEPSE